MTTSNIPPTTVRSDVEERIAKERLAWNDKNVPAWPKNINVLWKFGPLHSALYEIKNVIRMHPEDKNV